MNKCTVPSIFRQNCHQIHRFCHSSSRESFAIKNANEEAIHSTSHASLASILNSKAVVVFHFRSFYSSLFLLRKYKSNFPIFIQPKVIFSCPNLEHPQQQQSSYNRSQNSKLRAFSRAHTPVGCLSGENANCESPLPSHTHIVSVPFV